MGARLAVLFFSSRSKSLFVLRIAKWKFCSICPRLKFVCTIVIRWAVDSVCTLSFSHVLTVFICGWGRSKRGRRRNNGI